MFAVRTKVILGIACGIGAAAGTLTYLTSRSIPQALLAAGAATSGSAHLLGQVVSTDPKRPTSDQDDNKDDGQNGIAGQQEA
jgi:hypothetical protein